ncbi:MAG: AI-2E family transporter, partial [Actinobacteria bacterium]|nr:AI-2E family transporter [Actinomycetota bacterium]
LALVLIFLLNPFVSALERRGIRRGFGTAIIYLVLTVMLLLAVYWLMPPLGRQVQGLVDRGPQIQEQAFETTERVAERLNLSLDALGLSALESETEPETAPQGSSSNGPSLLQGLYQSLFAGAGRFATGAFHLLLNIILGPVFAAYLLIDLPRIQKVGLNYMPPSLRREWIPLLDRIGKIVGSFFRGQLLVAAIVGVMSCVAFLLIDLPYWLPIGLLAGFFNIIPLIGPFVGGAVAAVVGGITGGLSLGVQAVVAMVVVQQIDNHFISPKIIGRALRLHPVAIMVTLILGASLGGIWGMLLAVPGLAVAKILFVHFYETRVMNNWDYLSRGRATRSDSAGFPGPDGLQEQEVEAASGEDPLFEPAGEGDKKGARIPL